jgi:hypothetical protein
MTKYPFYRLVLIFLGCVLLFAACGERFDYRHKYIGDYNVHTVISYPAVPSISSSSFDFEGSVELGAKGNVVLYYIDGEVLEMTIDKSGNLEPFFEVGVQEISGKFEDRKHFEVTISNGYLMEITGVRRDK